MPPDVRKWLCPSGNGALVLRGYAPSRQDQVESGLPGATLWPVSTIFGAKLSGHSPIKKSELTEGHSHFRTSGGIAAKNDCTKFVRMPMLQARGF
jgi:hypothetical protein